MKRILKRRDGLLKSFRFILLPLSAIYGSIIKIRNTFYDKNILKSSSFNFPIICVGNLAVGGTGKTPMVEYLVRLLKSEFKVATLSRGYKRKTEGFAVAGTNTTALDIGDEPMQFYKKFPDITVAVAEERLVAIPQLLHEKPETQVIILDDAFQHRQVKAGLNILLTRFKDLYTKDFILPAGDLRDVRSSSKRADIIVVTKCKYDLTENEKDVIVREIDPFPHQKIFFSEINYGIPYHLFSKEEKLLMQNTNVLLIYGIANPKPLKDFLKTKVSNYLKMAYEDHHIFDMDELKEIKKRFEKIDSENKIILTTEKDGVRMAKFENELKDLPIYIIPIRHKILFGEEILFNQSIISFIKRYNRKVTLG